MICICWHTITVIVLGKLSHQANWGSHFGICLSYQCCWSVKDHNPVIIACLQESLVTSTTLTSSTVASPAKVNGPILLLTHLPTLFCISMYLPWDGLHLQKNLFHLLYTRKTWIHQWQVFWPSQSLNLLTIGAASSPTSMSEVDGISNCEGDRWVVGVAG